MFKCVQRFYLTQLARITSRFSPFIPYILYSVFLRILATLDIILTIVESAIAFPIAAQR